MKQALLYIALCLIEAIIVGVLAGSLGASLPICGLMMALMLLFGGIQWKRLS